MPALSTSFVNTARRATLGLMASVALGTVATPAAAQEAAPAPAAAAATTTTTTAEDGSVTTLNQITCVETYSRERRNGGFLGIIGNSRSSESSTTSNEQCRKDTRDAAVAFSLMTATNSDGSPDMPMRALGLEMYRNSSDGARTRIDTLLAAAGTSYQDIVFSTTPSGASALCVRQPAAALPAAPGTTASTAPVRVSVSFRCTQPGAAPAAPPATPLPVDAAVTGTTDAAAAETTVTAAAPPVVAAAPRP